MKYIVETQKSVEQTVADLQAAVVRHKFDLLHIHDLQKENKEKDADFPNACHVLEINHPQSTKDMLTVDMDLNIMLPCRISVYSENGKTKIGMIRHTAILKILSDSTEMVRIAQEAEAAIITMINESV